MSSHSANPNPEGVNAVWRAVHKIEKQLIDVQDSIDTAPSVWSKLWAERSWLIPTILVVLGAIGTATWYVGTLILDRHIHAAIDPVNSNVEALRALPLQNVAQMGQDIASIKATLQAWSPLIAPQILKRSSTLPQPEFEKSLVQLKAVADLASETGAPAKRSEIADVGKRTIALAAGDSEYSAQAWEATTSLLRYQSVVNSFGQHPDLAAAASVPGYQTKYFDYAEPGLPIPDAAIVHGPVPKSEAAELDLIGQDQNSDQTSGPPVLILKGGNITLDKMHLKKVVLVNVHVVYKGGPLQLNDVYFLNCTFDVTHVPNGVSFADRILTDDTASTSLSVS
jgi:hypothetical protein